MIAEFELLFGPVPGSGPTRIPATPVTIFVGPNNSGKSRALRELERFCRRGAADANSLIVSDMTFEGRSVEQASAAVGRVCQPPMLGETASPGHVFLGSRHGRLHVPLLTLTEIVAQPDRNAPAFCQWFLTHQTLMLDGRSRIGLVGAQGAGDMQAPPDSSFQVLFRDDVRRANVRRILFEAFGRHFVLDPTNLGQLRPRLADRAPSSDLEERGIHAEAVAFHAAAQLIEDSSDGVKAFTGIITELLAGDPSVVLIDEPEAFLHPSLASKLGMEVARAALGSNKRVFVATHSAQFVMGCIQSGAPVTVVRLTYRSGSATARVLPSDELLKLMRHPLLRSTGLLAGLFYEFVVVAESDSDRAFYQEINARLLASGSGLGIPDCLFLNAQNKQTVQVLVRPLRKLGIPAAGIVDIDIVKDGGADWTSLLTAAGVPQVSHNALAMLRSAIKATLEATGQDMKRGGMQLLAKPDREAAEGLLFQLADYGIFVVPDGELESWLKPLNVPGHGSSWLIEMFQRMGQDPTMPEYVRPGDGDVWGFLAKVQKWLLDPSRKGLGHL